MRTTAVVLFCSALLPAAIFAQQTATQGPPTVAEARAFIDRANAELLKLNTDFAHAEWTAETDITEDTEATGARMNESVTARTLALAAESHRFDQLQLPDRTCAARSCCCR